MKQVNVKVVTTKELTSYTRATQLLFKNDVVPNMIIRHERVYLEDGEVVKREPLEPISRVFEFNKSFELFRPDTGESLGVRVSQTELLSILYSMYKTMVLQLPEIIVAPVEPTPEPEVIEPEPVEPEEEE
jgi:hypothetical protein